MKRYSYTLYLYQWLRGYQFLRSREIGVSRWRNLADGATLQELLQ